MKHGCVHIYTGKGKGKTTAAVGLAVRAKSRGLKVLFIQFMKSDVDKGETNVLKNLSVKIKKFSKISSPFFNPDINRDQLKKNTTKALSFIKKITRNEKFDMIILDEFNCLLSEKLITEDEALDLILNKPSSLELVLTGRGATKRLIRNADYVTEMKITKHPFSNGVKARKGIEF
ncbi:MAG: cob(I)yrinic acid a,c-diamide adenosyltransferase [Nitrospiraceae bacterium]|nr:cob(I)yrinic acid a,c-diamide adenosyltransferase [Nitrospiraceae bacterium]